MNAGGNWKGTNFHVTVYWPTLGDRRDFSYWQTVGQWVAKNEKVLNRKALPDLCRLTMEQFPELALVEAKDFAGRNARAST